MGWNDESNALSWQEACGKRATVKELEQGKVCPEGTQNAAAQFKPPACPCNWNSAGEKEWIEKEIFSEICRFWSGDLGKAKQNQANAGSNLVFTKPIAVSCKFAAITTLEDCPVLHEYQADSLSDEEAEESLVFAHDPLEDGESRPSNLVTSSNEFSPKSYYSVKFW